jgi:hypothetical protein
VEFGVVARYFPSKKAGLIQVSADDVIFFLNKDAHHLKLDTTHNRIIFASRRNLIPRVGELVVFDRHRYYSTVPGLTQARMWGAYVTWVVLHSTQVMNLKRLVRSQSPGAVQ